MGVSRTALVIFFTLVTSYLRFSRSTAGWKTCSMFDPYAIRFLGPSADRPNGAACLPREPTREKDCNYADRCVRSECGGCLNGTPDFLAIWFFVAVIQQQAGWKVRRAARLFCALGRAFSGSVR